MRSILEESLYNFVYITGMISKFGEMKFDGNSTILKVNPIRFSNGELINPIHFKGKTTLIVNATINGCIIEDGHMWIAEDLFMKGFDIGNIVDICGNVEKYRRGDGTFDFCVSLRNIKLIGIY